MTQPISAATTTTVYPVDGAVIPIVTVVMDQMNVIVVRFGFFLTLLYSFFTPNFGIHKKVKRP